jgi:ubiquinone/menaquinone biosynthesis C-methylase UbiE
MSSNLIRFYESAAEADRLTSGAGLLEFIRTCRIIERYLATPGRVLDVGGAAGIYSTWLLRAGHDVTLVDPVAKHVAQATQAFAANTSDHARAEIGDARSLRFEDATFDAVLLLGPLYHLTSASDRKQALQEALRVTRKGGLTFVTGISRFASLLDGLSRGLLRDPSFVRIVEQDLRTGVHENPTARLDYFTDAYFHKPDELTREVGDAGWEVITRVAVEGPFAWIPYIRKLLNNDELHAFALETLDLIEAEESIIGASPHLLVVARRPR